MHDGPDQLTQLLRALRKREHGMTQEELARRTGISAGMIGNVERGARLYGPEALEAVADALNASDEERDQLWHAQEERRERMAPPASRYGSYGGGKTEAFIRGIDLNSDALTLSEEALEKIREIIREELRKQRG